MAERQIVCIDLGDYEKNKKVITEQLMSAACDIGFFYITNHGIAQADIDAAFEVNKRFFDLPNELKAKTSGDKSNKSYILGWSEEKMTAGTLRSGYLAGYDHSRMEGLWPDEDCPEYKPAVLRFMQQNHEVTMRIMACFALGLGLPEDFFVEDMDPKHEDCATAIYNNFYPPTEGKDLPDGMLRIGAHTDFEAGQPGLEICPGKDTARDKVKSDAQWTACDPMPGCITVNIGDCLQYWSDERLKSTYHRVRVPRANEYQGARYSMAYFANVRLSTVVQGPKKKYPPITFADILAKKSENQINKYSDTEIEKFTPEEYLNFQNMWPTGPEFEEANKPLEPQPEVVAA